MFFINWWGDGQQPREGFKHHVYTKTNEPDPDTDFNFGSECPEPQAHRLGRHHRQGRGERPRHNEARLVPRPLRGARLVHRQLERRRSRTSTATASRITGCRRSGSTSTPGGYRPASGLTGDLSKVSRYVAIDLFFTSSPLYPPQFTPRLLPNKINLDVNTIEGIPDTNSSARYQTPGLMVDEISELHRLPYNIDQQDLAYDSEAKRCYTHWLKDVPCYQGKYPAYPADANLFLYGVENLGRLLDDERSRREYEATLINWAVEDGANFQTSPPLLGLADDDYRTGVQSFIYSFVSPDIAQAYGLTTTEIHEYGHHLNLSHPFDGFDYESETDFGWKADSTSPGSVTRATR